MIRKGVILALAVTLSGCASIGTINGVRMNATTPSGDTYCDQPANRVTCILLAAGAIGGLAALFLANTNHHSTPSSSAPPPS